MKTTIVHSVESIYLEGVFKNMEHDAGIKTTYHYDWEIDLNKEFPEFPEFEKCMAEYINGDCSNTTRAIFSYKRNGISQGALIFINSDSK
jgi:hypothetical protein